MINLVFTFQREVMNFRISNREVYYTDRKWKSLVRCIPKDEELITKVRMSRNAIPISIVKLFDIPKSRMEEYNKAETDEEIADIIIYDAKKVGCILRKREDIKDGRFNE